MGLSPANSARRVAETESGQLPAPLPRLCPLAQPFANLCEAIEQAREGLAVRRVR